MDESLLDKFETAQYEDQIGVYLTALEKGQLDEDTAFEMLNTLFEQTAVLRQRARFDDDNRKRAQQGLRRHAVDEQLLAALEHGLDDCAGVALGLDRLLMVLLDLDRIDQVLTFSD